MRNDKNTAPENGRATDKKPEEAPVDPLPDDGGAAGGIDDPSAVGGGNGPDAEED